jgi:uncharacterized membrane protein
MSLDIGRAFGHGIDGVATRVGGILVGAWFVVQLVSTTAMRTMLGPMAAPQSGLQTLPDVALPVDPAVGGLLFVVAWLVSLALYVVFARVAVSGRTDTIPGELYSRRLGGATAHLLVAFVLGGFLVGIGMVLLVVPGLFLAVSFAFTLFYVAVEDDGAIEAMKHSWSLASGNRLRVFLLLLLVGVVTGLPSTVVTVLVGSSVVGWLVSSLVGSVTYVYSVYVMADAFTQLRDGGRADGVDADPAATPA